MILLQVVHGVLPPGYEDELYCPSDMCLKSKAQPPGWCGPRSDFNECCNEANGSTAHPHSWGFKIPEEVKGELIESGWHMLECVGQTGMCGAKSKPALTAMANQLMHRMSSLFPDYITTV